MSGGKGGSSSTSVEIPEWLEDPTKRTLARAEAIADIPFTPYSGPEVAAFSPMQDAAFANTQAAASAFGMDPGTGSYMPTPMQSGGAVGYGSLDGYRAAIEWLKRTKPGAYAAINGGYQAAGDPYNTLGGMRQMADPAPAGGPPAGSFDGQQERRQEESMNDMLAASRAQQAANAPTFSSPFSGYSGFGDMFDGGGPGASGSTYSGGGLLSSAANRVSGRR